MRRLIALLLTATALGCGGTVEPKIEMSGAWIGVINAQSLSLTLVESGGIVTGDGNITNTPFGTKAVIVSGSFASPNFSLTITPSGLSPFNFQGKYNPSAPAQLVGTLSGSGFDGAQFIMNKHS